MEVQFVLRGMNDKDEQVAMDTGTEGLLYTTVHINKKIREWYKDKGVVRIDIAIIVLTGG